MAVQTKGFLIVSPGDSSVGIFKKEWELTDDFHFESEEDLNEFRGLLKQAFEMIADDAYVETIEERVAWVENEFDQSK